jgi:DnaJ-class molecular chaperone
MASKCNKCGGIGFIDKFSGVENGTCFKCEGTGVTLTAAERNAILIERSKRHNARMAKEQGVSLEVFEAYVSCDPNKVPVPEHPNGCSFSIQEYAEFLSAA